MPVLKDFPMVADNSIVLPYIHAYTHRQLRTLLSEAQPAGTDEIRNKFLVTSANKNKIQSTSATARPSFSCRRGCTSLLQDIHNPVRPIVDAAEPGVIYVHVRIARFAPPREKKTTFYF